MTDILAAAEETIRLANEAKRLQFSPEANAAFVAHLAHAVAISEALLEAQKRIAGLEKALRDLADDYATINPKYHNTAVYAAAIAVLPTAQKP